MSRVISICAALALGALVPWQRMKPSEDSLREARLAQRQGFVRLGGISDGELLMHCEFMPGLVNSLAAGPSVTLYQHLSGTTSPSAGFGSYLAS